MHVFDMDTQTVTYNGPRIDTLSLYSNPPSMSMGHWRRFSPRCPGSTPFSKNSPVLFQSNNSFPLFSAHSDLSFFFFFSSLLILSWGFQFLISAHVIITEALFFFFFSFSFFPFCFPISYISFFCFLFFFGIFLHLPFLPFPCVTALCSLCPCDSISPFHQLDIIPASFTYLVLLFPNNTNVGQSQRSRP